MMSKKKKNMLHQYIDKNNAQNSEENMHTRFFLFGKYDHVYIIRFTHYCFVYVLWTSDEKPKTNYDTSYYQQTNSNPNSNPN